MKRFLRIVSGLLLLLAGAGLATVGVMALAIFGQEGQAQTQSQRLTSDPASAAIVADVTTVDVALPFADRIGTANLSAVSTKDTSVFIGTGEQDAVDTYLYGVPYDLASNTGRWSLTPVPGVAAAAPDPLQQNLWIERDLGTEAVIELPLDGGPQTLVIMNADGAPSVDVEVSLGFSGPYLFWASVAAIVVGVLLILLGLVVLLKGRRARRARRAAARAEAAEAAHIAEAGEAEETAQPAEAGEAEQTAQPAEPAGAAEAISAEPQS